MSNWIRIRNPCSRLINTGIFDKMKYPCQTDLTWFSHCVLRPAIFVGWTTKFAASLSTLLIVLCKIHSNPNVKDFPFCAILQYVAQTFKFRWWISPSLSIFSPFPWPFWITFVDSSPFFPAETPIFLSSSPQTAPTHSPRHRGRCHVLKRHQLSTTGCTAQGVAGRAER